MGDEREPSLAERSALRNFEQVLSRIDDGKLSNELAETYQDLMAAMVQAKIDGGGTKIKGQIALTLKFELDCKSDHLAVAGDVKVKEPPIVRGGSIFYLTGDNHLTPYNPRQQELPFRDVTAQAAALRDV